MEAACHATRDAMSNDTPAEVSTSRNGSTARQKYFLCVDGGGSSCTAALISSSGATSIGAAGPCNPSTIGIEATISVISSAISIALSLHVETKARSISDMPLSSAWVGIAGYDRPYLAPAIDSAVSQLLGIPVGPRLTITTDIDLLSVNAAKQPSVESAIVLVAGTGSIAMSYLRKDRKRTLARTGRIGGWGPLLGDDGSGFAIGREALRIALRTSDSIGADPRGQDVPSLSKAVFEHFSKESQGRFDPSNLLSSILAPTTTAEGSLPNSHSPTKTIARAAQLVLSLSSTDDQAKQILECGAKSLADMVIELLELKNMSPLNAAFIMAGGLLCNTVYNNMVRNELKKRGVEFKFAIRVEAPALEGARFLVNNEVSV